jgi:DUF1009 family protein
MDVRDTPESLGIIAGNGRYPLILANAARAAGVKRIAVAAFAGETEKEIESLADEIEWLRVGQLGRLVSFFKSRSVRSAMMAGQIAPKNLFDLRPDVKALLLLAKLRVRNAESIFSAIADELDRAGTRLLPATTFLEDLLATPGSLAGPAPKKRLMEDAAFGFRIAIETSRLDIGQTVVVRNGTVLAVEAFEGTNEAIKRGGSLGRKDAVAVKVSKPDQDFRFDVPVIGPATIETAADAGIRLVAIEAGRTLILDAGRVAAIAAARGVSVVGIESQ